MDHAPLVHASRSGRPVVGLYIVEPLVWQAPTADARQRAFVSASLAWLRGALADIGGHLVVRQGEAVSVLSGLHRDIGIHTLWSHEETGELDTFHRDIAVAKWARTCGVSFREVQNHGVCRPHRGRDGWAGRWLTFMSKPRFKSRNDSRRPNSCLGFKTSRQTPTSGPILGRGWIPTLPRPPGRLAA